MSVRVGAFPVYFRLNCFMKCLRSGGIAAVLLTGIVVAGCTRGTVSQDPGQAPKSEAAAAEDLLTSAVHQLRPENYTIAAAQDKPVNLLNSWRANVTSAPGADLDFTKFPASWIRASEADRLKAASYDLVDAIHIRDAMLVHTLAKAIASRATDELGQVQAIFDFVMRNIALRGPADPEEMPVGIYNLLLLGSGTPEDRAWIMADLLRQLRIDTVIVRPAGASPDDPEQWLIGVVRENELHLFDPRLGIAIPSETPVTAAPVKAATLRQVQANPQLLDALAARADQAYPIDADQLKSPGIEPIVETDFWSRRMRDLETVLPAEELCVLYDAPLDEGERQGLLSRLKKAFPDEAPDKFKVWAYPAKVRETRQFSPAALEVLQLFDRTLQLPVQFQPNPQTNQLELVRAENKVLRYRTEQLLGKFTDAMQHYLAIRHLEIDPAQSNIPPLILLNRAAAENAYYWTALCKFELGDFDGAIEQLSGYVKRYERNGRWIYPARRLLAQAMSEDGQAERAVELLRTTSSEDPNRAANAILMKRLTAEKPTAK